MAQWKIQGIKSTRRLVREIPRQMHIEMVHVLSDAGPKIVRQMVARTPRKTGALQAGIKWKVLPKTLKLQVGLLGTKRGRARLFYGWILNFGRKAQVAQGMRQAGRAIWMKGIAAGFMRASKRPSSLTYPIRVKAIAAKHFVTGALPDLRNTLRTDLSRVWDKVLRRASVGNDNE